MEESRERAAVLDASLDERLVERVLSAAESATSKERIRAGVEAVVEIAELDPGSVNEALATLRSDPASLQRLEDGLSLPASGATLALGGAIQLARAELSSPDPDLRSRMPELVRWLQGAW